MQRPPAILVLLVVVLVAPVIGGGQGGLHAPRRTVARPGSARTDRPPFVADFQDVAERAGVDVTIASGGQAAKRFLFETTGSGVALFDADGDGRLDIYLANGTTLGDDPSGHDASARLYRNLGGLRFEDVTSRAGLRRTGWGQGVCVGDYDNDGRRDLLATYYGRSVLYHNRGDGRFEDVTIAAGVHRPDARWDSGCTFVDVDLDGRLDVFIANYVAFDPATVPEPGSRDSCRYKGLAVPCGPPGLPFGRNYLFRNRGDGTFTDVSAESGVAKAAGCYGLTAAASDIDGDGDADIYVACDLTPSLLYRNRGDGTFEEVGLLAGAALNEDGQTQAGMGVAIADYDEDGAQDIIKTNFSDDVPNVYRNLGDATFEDRVFEAGVGGYLEFVGWGVHLLDVDHDGWRDLFMVNGHVYPQAEQRGGVAYKQRRLLYWNVGGRFIDVSAAAGPAVGAARSSRGSAAGDLDDDGRLEIVVSNIGDRPSILKNLGPTRHWLLVECVGTRANRDAIGARVWVSTGGRRLSGEVQGASSYLSQNDHRLHFGLSDASRYDGIEVLWPGGRREVFPAGDADRTVALVEGKGRAP